MAKATKAAREKAKDLGINLDDVEGSGSGGQITVGDINSYDEERPKQESDENGYFFKDAETGEIPGDPRDDRDPGSEARKDSEFLQEQAQRGRDLRFESPTVTKDVQDVYEMELAARERGDRGMDGYFEESPGGLRFATRPEDIEKEEIVSEQVKIHFNPDAATNRVVVDGAAYEEGDIMETSVFEGVRDMVSGGHPVFLEVEEVNSEDQAEEGQVAESEAKNKTSEDGPLPREESSGKDVPEDKSSEQQAVREGGE